MSRDLSFVDDLVALFRFAGFATFLAFRRLGALLTFVAPVSLLAAPPALPALALLTLLTGQTLLGPRRLVRLGRLAQLALLATPFRLFGRLLLLGTNDSLPGPAEGQLRLRRTTRRIGDSTTRHVTGNVLRIQTDTVVVTRVEQNLDHLDRLIGKVENVSSFDDHLTLSLAEIGGTDLDNIINNRKRNKRD